MVERFVAALSDNSHAPETRAKTVMILKAVFEKGIQWGYLAVNPARYVKRPRVPKCEVEFLEPHEIFALIEATDPRYRCLMMFAALSGCRLSEILGLKWQDVDFANGKVHIRQTLQGGQFLAPKTDTSRRSIDLPPILMEEIATHQTRQMVELDSNEYDLVFPNQVGRPEQPGNLRRRVLKPACRCAGLRKVGFHALRHSYVSMLVAQGENVKTIQALVGHSSAKITWDTYSHLFDGTTKEAACRLEKTFFEVEKKQDQPEITVG